MPVADMFPSLRGHVDLAFSAPDKADLTQCDVVFFATPHGVAMAQAPELLAAGVKVIDLAADFRLQGHAPCSKNGTRCRTPARTCWRKRCTACRN